MIARSIQVHSELPEPEEKTFVTADSLQELRVEIPGYYLSQVHPRGTSTQNSLRSSNDQVLSFLLCCWLIQIPEDATSESELTYTDSPTSTSDASTPTSTARTISPEEKMDW